MFSAEVRKLHEYFGTPEWDCIDDNLRFLFNAVNLAMIYNKALRVASRLDDRTYLDQLINNEDLGSFTLTFAITDLCEYAGLDAEDPRVWHNIPDQASIMDIVKKVYSVA